MKPKNVAIVGYFGPEGIELWGVFWTRREAADALQSRGYWRFGSGEKKGYWSKRGSYQTLDIEEWRIGDLSHD